MTPSLERKLNCSTTYDGRTTMIDSLDGSCSKLHSLSGRLDAQTSQEHVAPCRWTAGQFLLLVAFLLTRCMGKVVSIARYLGCRRSYNANQPEINCRVSAAFRGVAAMGSFGQRAAGFVLAPSEVRSLDKTILLGRKALRGKACTKSIEVQEDGGQAVEYAAKTNTLVWQALQLSPCKTLVTSNLAFNYSFLQQETRAPAKHVALCVFAHATLAETGVSTPTHGLFSFAPTLRRCGGSHSRRWQTLDFYCNFL